MRDFYAEIEGAVAPGLLLAKQRPDLADACSQYWNHTRESTPEEYVNRWLNLFHFLPHQRSLLIGTTSQ